MKITLQVVIECDNEPPIVDEIACLEREALTSDTLGLTLAEAKMVLSQQRRLAELLRRRACRIAGHHLSL